MRLSPVRRRPSSEPTMSWMGEATLLYFMRRETIGANKLDVALFATKRPTVLHFRTIMFSRASAKGLLTSVTPSCSHDSAWQPIASLILDVPSGQDTGSKYTLGKEDSLLCVALRIVIGTETRR